MTNVKFFVKKPETRQYNIQNKKFKLEVNEHVFPPSPQGAMFFAGNLRINPDEKVIDIGTGTGFLAILASKLGGKVCATDIDPDAVTLAAKNAQTNHENIIFKTGSYFADFNKKFDVILANLPQEIVHRNYRKAIGKQLTDSFHGGPDGNKQLLQFLDLAKGHMTSKSRIYFIVYTVTDYAGTLNKILENYNAHLIAFRRVTPKEFVADNIEWYKKMNDKGKIQIFKPGKTWLANEFLFELTKKD